jgi:hypothetical protein
MDEPKVTNNCAMNQCKLFAEGKSAVLQYRPDPGWITLLHTEALEEFAGGIFDSGAGQTMKAAFVKDFTRRL